MNSFVLVFLTRDENNAHGDVGEFNLASEPLGLNEWLMAHFHDKGLRLKMFSLSQRARILKNKDYADLQAGSSVVKMSHQPFI